MAQQKVEIFRTNPLHPTLRTHKLSHGELWAFSVDYHNRVIFQFLANGQALLVNVGDHSIYRKIA